MATAETTKPVANSEVASKYDKALSKILTRTASHLKFADFVGGILRIGCFVLAGFFLLAVVDAWVWQLPIWARFLSVLVLAGGAIWIGVKFLLPFLISSINPLYAAKMIEDGHPHLKNSLLNYVSLTVDSQSKESIKKGVLEAASRRAAVDATNVPGEQAIDYTPVIRAMFLFTSIVAIFAVYCMFSSRSPFPTITRLLAPFQNVAPPRRVSIEDVKPDGGNFFLGDPIKITAKIAGLLEDEKPIVVYETVDKQYVDSVAALVPQEDSPGSYLATIETGKDGVQKDVVFRISAGDNQSRDYRLYIAQKPTVILEKVDLQFPKYTESPSQTVHGQGDLEVVEGTKITVHAYSNSKLKSAVIELYNTDADPKLIRNVEQLDYVKNYELKIGEDNKFKGSFYAQVLPGQRNKYTHYRLTCKDETGAPGQPSPVFRLNIVPDLAPEVKIIRPAESSVSVPMNRTVPIRFQGIDPDYRLTKLSLSLKGGFQFEKEHNVKLGGDAESQSDGSGMVSGQYVFVPADHKLRVGDEVTVIAFAEDNRHSTEREKLQPNRSESTPVTIKITKEVEEKKEEEKKEGDNKQKDDTSNSGDSEKNPNKDGDDNKEGSKENGNQNDSGSKENSSDNKDQKNKQTENKQSAGGGDNSTDNSSSENKGESQSSENSGNDRPNKNQSENKGDNSSNKNRQQGDSSSKPDNPSEEKPPEIDNEGDIFEEIKKQIEKEKKQKEKPGEQKSGEQKSGEQKSGEQKSGEQKSGEQKSGEQKSGEQKSGEQKSGEQKSGEQKSGEQKSGEQKSGEQKSGEQKSGEQKSGEQKSGEQKSGEQKSGEQKSGEQKSGEQKSGEQKSGEQKSGEQKSGEQKSGEQKSGEQKSGEQKSGEQKSGEQKSGEQKSGEQKSGEQKSGEQKSGEQKSGEQKSGEQKSGEQKSGEQKSGEQKSGEQKSGEQKSGEQKSGEQKSGEQKSGEQKSGEQKSGEQKSGEQSVKKQSGQQKSGQQKSGQQKSGQQKSGQQKSGQQKSGQQKSGQKKSGQQKSGQQKSGQQKSGQQKSGQQKSGQQKSGQQKSGQQKSGQQKSGQQKSGQQKSGQQKSGGKNSNQQSSQSPNSNSPSKDGTGAGGEAGGSNRGSENQQGAPDDGGEGIDNATEGDKVNEDYSNKTVDMVVKYLDEQKNDPDKDLLNRLNWTKEDLQDFVRRWKSMKEKAESGSDAEKRAFKRKLKSLGLGRHKSGNLKSRIKKDELKGLNQDGTRVTIPFEHASRFGAFLKGKARSENE